MLMVVAPSSSAICTTSAVYSRSARVASIGENSTSSVYCFECATAARAWPFTSSRVVWSWCSMWMSLVEMNVWMRGRSESRIAFQAASMSWKPVRARPQITGPCTSRAMACTASKSPGDAIGKPADFFVLNARAGEAVYHRADRHARHGLLRLEVAGRCDREAGLDHVDAQASELVGDLELLLLVEADARRLLAVAERRIEDAYVICVGCAVVHAIPFGSLPAFSSSSECGSAAATRYSPRGGRRRSRRRARRDCMRVASVAALPPSSHDRALTRHGRPRGLGPRPRL